MILPVLAGISITLSATAVPQPIFSANPAQVTFYAPAGQPASAVSIPIAITSASSGSSYTVSSNQPWLTYSPSTNSTGGVTTVNLSATAASLAAGVYTGTVTFSVGPVNAKTTVIFNVSSPSGALTAASGGPFAVGTQPRSVAVGDFNGDGKLDFATANSVTNNVSVMLGNGAGGFTQASGSPITVGTSPNFIAVGDFNSDGKLDFATANSNNSVTVMLGNGFGGFTQASGSPFTVGTQPQSLAVGDFDGDGKLDFATANYSNVTVMLGNGSGGFTEASGSPFTGGTDPRSIAVGDFNGDGKLDLATANYGSGNVIVMMGNGTGGFTQASGSPFLPATSPVTVVVGDFNGDGKLDFATANAGDNNVRVMLGDGTGGFIQASGSPFTSGSNPYVMAVGDFNGDGKLDLATANFFASNVTVMLGNGSGGFTQASGSPFTAGSTIWPIAVGDFNGDGRMDLAAASYYNDSVTVLLGGLALTSGTVSTTAASSVPYGTAVPLTLTLNPGVDPLSAVPSGTVTFYDGASLLGIGSQSASPYTFTTSTLAGGAHSLSAVYGGDVRNATSTSNTIPVTITQFSQTITFNSLSGRTYSAVPFGIGATASSGLAVTFTSLTGSVCAVSGTSVTMLGSGLCTIQAAQAGNGPYAPAAAVNQSFAIALLSQTITFGPAPSPAVSNTAVTVNATGGASGNTVTFTSATPAICTVSGATGATVALVAAGTCTINANQAGNANYAPSAPVSQSFNVANPAGGAMPYNVGFFQPVGPTWALDSNGSGGFDAGDRVFAFAGQPGAIAVTGDWNGDGKTKVGFYLNGFWVLDYNGNGVYDGTGPGGDKFYAFGGAGAAYVPIVGDWNGDGKSKVGFYNNGFWALDTNGNGQWDGSPVDSFYGFGGKGAGEVPLLGDWNGDGRTKVGYFFNGSWVLDYDGNGSFSAADKNYTTFPYSPGDKPVIGDWTGDGKTKIGIFRGGFWILDTNNNGTYDGVGVGQDKFFGFGGNPGEIPLVADWNGSGTSKIGIYINGFWVLDYNGNGGYDGTGPGGDRFIPFGGSAGNQPIVGRW